jgi:hypothetical protein
MVRLSSARRWVQPMCCATGSVRCMWCASFMVSCCRLTSPAASIVCRNPAAGAHARPHRCCGDVTSLSLEAGSSGGGGAKAVDSASGVRETGGGRDMVAAAAAAAVAAAVVGKVLSWTVRTAAKRVFKTRRSIMSWCRSMSVASTVLRGGRRSVNMDIKRTMGWMGVRRCRRRGHALLFFKNHQPSTAAGLRQSGT